MILFLIPAAMLIYASFRLAHEPFKDYRRSGDKTCWFFIVLFLLSGTPAWVLVYHILTHWR